MRFLFNHWHWKKEIVLMGRGVPILVSFLYDRAKFLQHRFILFFFLSTQKCISSHVLGRMHQIKTPRNSRITPELLVLRTRFMSQFCNLEFGNGGFKNFGQFVDPCSWGSNKGRGSDKRVVHIDARRWPSYNSCWEIKFPDLCFLRTTLAH